eukprot:CAMPEP_0198246304 /NCGR_PEP_ID=MMETSP1446-20131203/45903_1 /TAXON_ID=1461542 ORGANISM="Unidentified sp, Strain CCMP2111" /NCGR_SAMPLE_ID=MMETSP1446 /ASSEMBLY_ACC=CAM_ASM_001112 /LENGTH=476 /DNA_ID=CAMNT_0043930623 /DNA_START=100 /DNA_END=1530 /DNA_ORIENTATION=-
MGPKPGSANADELDGADVEDGFSVLAKGMFEKTKPGKMRRSKANRQRNAAGQGPAAGKGVSALRSLMDDAQEVHLDTRERSRVLCERILRMHQSKQSASLSGRMHQAAEKRPVPSSKFVEVSSGMRMRYLEWGPSSSKEVVIFLHGLGESSEAWVSLAHKLGSHGYLILAPDLRGHGRSTWSSETLYTPEAMAEDLKDMVLHLDLYASPFAVMGVDIGAACAVEFASKYPKLVGLLACIDYTPFCDAARMSFCKIQGVGSVANRESALQLLTSPLLGPQTRSLESAGKAVSVMFHSCSDSGVEQLKPTMDPDFRFQFARVSLAASLASVECHLLLLNSPGHSSRAEMDDAQKVATIAASVEIVQIEKSRGFSLSDSPFEVYSEVKKALHTHQHCFLSEGLRTPESLGLRALPQFQTLEEAFKALGPRKLVTKEAIEEELDKLRKEDGYISSDDDDLYDNGQTALANNPKEYFGMVG